MRTEQLILALATNANSERLPSVRTLISASLAIAVAISFLLMVKLLPIRADIATAVALPMFWVKLGFSGVIAAACLPLVFRLARPGASLGAAPLWIAVPIVGMWILGASDLAVADRSEWPRLILGKTWAVCPFLITMLATPVFIATFRALREFAPTQLRATGATAGLLSGALGAFVYSIHCPEMEPAFLGTWYFLGMAIPAIAGYLVAPRLLRWS